MRKNVELFYMNAFFWWISKIFIGIASLFLFIRGVEVLIGSYSLNNPAEFIMYFFSSSMLILVSAVGVIYSAIRIFKRIREES
ncbi:MAG: hypothetical protein JRC90_06305 [Deltaproteobacteria bacterium]|nr:hypothetical protein [Deltaproteobacteria bacterium]